MKIKKILPIIFIFAIWMINSVFAYEYRNDRPELRDYQYFTIQKGTFFKGLLQQEVSTSTHVEGDSVRLINQFDVILRDTLIIPKDALFLGFISKLQEPIEGRDALMTIKVNKILYPSGHSLEINAHIWSDKDDILGGDITPRSSYKKMPHHSEGYRNGILQILPDGPRMMGKDLIFDVGKELIIQLDEDLNIKLGNDI